MDHTEETRENLIQVDLRKIMEDSFLDYSMSVIVSRALPDVRDGLKPVHRRILYTMYENSLWPEKAYRKCADTVGAVLGRYHPHGDVSVYDALVRLAQDFSMRYMLVDGHGNFGSVDGDPAAAYRYTEARMAKLSVEMLRDIDKDTVDFEPNYDDRLKEPCVLPSHFPNILVNGSTGIAVGMASSICPFNLAEVCNTAIELMKNPKHDLFTTMQAPDFPGGGQIIFDRKAMEQIYETGRGSIRVRARYTFDKAANCIDITQIPPTTTIEAIVEKVIDLVKQGKLKELTDIRDETGLDGLKITIDLKRGTDPEKLMQRLFKMTSLEDSFACNFNVLIAGVPRVLGVRALFEEWTAFRVECVRRRTYFDLTKKKEKLHLLYGLRAILLDIDKAIRIVRETAEESEVVPNLMIGFGIDAVQAEYVAEIKLRHLNREFILKRTEEIENLEAEIRDLEAVLASKSRIKTIITRELSEIAQKYGQPRRSLILYADEIHEEEPVEEIPDYPVNLFFTREGYFKKITPLSLRMGGEQKLKEGDAIVRQLESTNAAELLFFSDRAQVYKMRAADFADMKASVMGEYIPARVQMDEGETAAAMAVTSDYSGFMLFVFENGKAAKVELSAYSTKTNRRKLLNAYSDKSPLVAALQLPEDGDVLLTASSGRMLLFNTGLIAPKATKSTQGVAAMTLKKGQRVLSAVVYQEGDLQNPARFKKKLPALGALPNGEEGRDAQTSL